MPTRAIQDMGPTSILPPASTESPPQSTHASPTPKRRLPKLLLAGTLASLTLYFLQPASPKTLNTATFAPYTVTSTIPASPTSFILTLTPKNPSRSLPYLTPSGSWWDFQWSVQVKQPELQIQREYTPLPPAPGSEGEEGGKDDGTLRFYVRRVAGGEVSNFLAKKAEGDTVEVRLGERGFAFSYLNASEASDILCLEAGRASRPPCKSRTPSSPESEVHLSREYASSGLSAGALTSRACRPPGHLRTGA